MHAQRFSTAHQLQIHLLFAHPCATPLWPQPTPSSLLCTSLVAQRMPWTDAALLLLLHCNAISSWHAAQAWEQAGPWQHSCPISGAVYESPCRHCNCGRIAACEVQGQQSKPITWERHETLQLGGASATSKPSLVQAVNTRGLGGEEVDS